MPIKDYLAKKFGIIEEQFDEFVESGVPICKELRDQELFELFVAYWTANRERRKVDEP